MKKILITIILLQISIFAVNAQALKTYSEQYTGKLTTGKVNYTYYEDGSDRIINGMYKYTGTSANGFVRNTTKGKLKDGLRTGLWNSNTQSLKRQGRFTYYNEKIIANFKDGYFNGQVNFNMEAREKWSGGIAVTKAVFKSNYKDGKFANNISSSLTNSGVLTVNIKGQFDDNGYMHGKWLIQYRERRNSFNDIKNSPLINDIRYYQHGILSKNIILKTSTGEILDKYDNSKVVDEFFTNYDTDKKISIIDDKVYEVADITGSRHVGFGYGNEHLVDLFGWFKDKTTLFIYEVPIGIKHKSIVVERELIETDPVRLALPYGQKGDFKKAIEYMNIAVQIDPNNINNNNGLGMYLFFDKQYSKAQDQLEATYKMCGGNCDNLLDIERNLSHAYILNNNYQKAFEIHKQNMNKQIEGKDWLSVIYEDFERLKHNNIFSKNFDKLKEDISNYNYNSMIKEGDKYFSNNDIEESEKEYKKALKLKPNKEYPKTQLKKIDKIKECNEHIKTADELFDNKKFSKAKKEYIAALNIDPDNTYALERKKKAGGKAVGKTIITILLFPFYLIGAVL